MFERLTAILPRLGNDAYATLPEQTGDGSEENPYIWLHYIYNDAVRSLIEESMRFVSEHEEMDLYDYQGILRAAGIRWESDALEKADVSGLDGRTVMAMVVAVVRAERFCDGALLEFCENGCIRRWLERLKEIDEADRERST